MNEAPLYFGYTILYVPNVEEAIAFYERAFDLKKAFVAPTGEYGEVITGQTKLGFTQIEFAKGLTDLNFAEIGNGQSVPPVELAFVTSDVQLFFQQAIAAGATEVKVPDAKPWGQTVAYVRDPNGYLIEICTEIKE